MPNAQKLDIEELEFALIAVLSGFQCGSTTSNVVMRFMRKLIQAEIARALKEHQASVNELNPTAQR